jgi:hypothetical protein
VATQLCGQGDICTFVTAVGENEQICAQGCDPTGKLGAPACASGKTCVQNSTATTNPYDGFCQ